MKNYKLILIGFATMLAACGSKPQNQPAAETTNAQEEQTTTSQENVGDMKLTDMNRDRVSMADEIAKNKITIIDFWASWCGPCRQEMPLVVKLYESHKAQGLGIIGISLDEEYDAWAQAIKAMNMTWPQFSDLRGWDDNAAQRFGVTAIPHTLVVDQQGNILAKGLRGEALHDFIDQQLGGH